MMLISVGDCRRPVYCWTFVCRCTRRQRHSTTCERPLNNTTMQTDQSTVPDPTGLRLILNYLSSPGGQSLARRALVVVM